MANNNLAKIDQFKGILNSQTIRAQLRNSLKDKAGQFMSSMIDLYSGDTYLQQCDPEKVALECVKAAALDLPLVKSLGYAYVVPYKNVPTFTIGYKGLIQLAQRTGQYLTTIWYYKRKYQIRGYIPVRFHTEKRPVSSFPDPLASLFSEGTKGNPFHQNIF